MEGKDYPRTDWYLVVHEWGTGGTFTEAYGPFEEPQAAGKYIDTWLEKYVSLPNVLLTDVEHVKFEIMYEFDTQVTLMTENEEIINPKSKE